MFTNSRSKHALCIALAGSLLFMTRGAAAAEVEIIDDPAYFDELAAAVQRKSNDLCWELHRYHQQQADFKAVYRSAKDVWSLAGAMRDMLRAGPADSGALAGQAAKMNDLLGSVEKAIAPWGDGVRSPGGPDQPDERVVVVPGSRVNFDIPLLFGGNIQVGRPPQVVVADPQSPLPPRGRFHPNAHRSKKALTREVASLRMSLDWLLEDTAAVPPEEPKPASVEPAAGPALSPPLKISPPAAKK